MTSFLTSTSFSFGLSNYRSFLSTGEQSFFKIVYDVKDSRWHELKLKNGSNLLNMPGTIHLRAHDEPLKNPAVIGTLNYIDAYEGSDDGVIRPSPEHFSIECVVPQEILNRIFDAENAGLGPTNVGVVVGEGLKYGWAPDGSDKIWESENDWVPVEQVSFTFARPNLDEADDSSDELDEPGENRDHLKEAIDHLTQKLDKSLLVVMALLAFIAATLAFK